LRLLLHLLWLLLLLHLLWQLLLFHLLWLLLLLHLLWLLLLLHLLWQLLWLLLLFHLLWLLLLLYLLWLLLLHLLWQLLLLHLLWRLLLHLTWLLLLPERAAIHSQIPDVRSGSELPLAAALVFQLSSFLFSMLQLLLTQRMRGCSCWKLLHLHYSAPPLYPQDRAVLPFQSVWH
jgi:hypothetical protein